MSEISSPTRESNSMLDSNGSDSQYFSQSAHNYVPDASPAEDARPPVTDHFTVSLRGGVESVPSKCYGSLLAKKEMNEVITPSGQGRAETELGQRVLDVKTTSGEFIWKIPAHLFSPAVRSGSNVTLTSPPLLSSSSGYKIFLRVYLNGDKSGKSTHISVLFVVSRTQHDMRLRWPFMQPVTFTLIGQGISKTFRPNFAPGKSCAVAGFACVVPQLASWSHICHRGRFTGNAVLIGCTVGT